MRARRYSGWILASFATFAHFFISAWMKSANCCGVPPAISMPASLIFFLMSGCARSLLNSALSLATTSLGVPAGARMPPHVLVS